MYTTSIAFGSATCENTRGGTLYPQSQRTVARLVSTSTDVFGRRSSKASTQPSMVARMSELELDPLRQRKIAGPVNRHGLPSHVLLPGIAARLASAARFLLAAERSADLRAAGSDVDVRY